MEVIQDAVLYKIKRAEPILCVWPALSFYGVNKMFFILLIIVYRKSFFRLFILN